MFDRDGNGYLDENEFFLFSAHNGNNFPREEVQIYMTGADANKDGKISKEEMIMWLKRQL